MSFIDNGTSDYRVQRWFQKQLLTNSSLSNSTKSALKGQAFCGTGVIAGKLCRSDNPDFAFIMTDGETARITNVIRCHSVWACPYCAPRAMAKKATDIACAIDALSKWHNQSAIMITFTLPHWRFASCKDTLSILQDAWRMFTRVGNHAGHSKYTRKDGTVGVKGRAPFGAFRQALNITHFVRAYEVTWSPAKGWHPHIHALYWVPNENWNKVLQYEKSLCDNWWHCCKYCAERYMKANHPKQYEKYFHRVYSDHKTDIHPSLWISKRNGKPIKQQSSMYIAGWSADAEMTGKYRSKEGNVDPDGVKHYAMHELIDEAYKNRDFPSISNKYLKLYCEFAVATRTRRRVEFSSRSGIGKIISKWKLSQTYMESIKKKLAEKPQKDWRVVVWFDQYQWSTIYHDEDGLFETILEMAVADDIVAARKKIAKYLLLYGIRLEDNAVRYPGSEEKVRRYEARMTA